MSRRILSYFLGIVFLSVMLLGFLWIKGRISGYYNEVELLKKTFSETKKTEIRNKILQIKDYIQWVQYNPATPVSKALSDQIETMNLHGRKAGSPNKKNPESSLQLFKDSSVNSRIPIYVFNANGNLVYSYNPFIKNENKKSFEDYHSMFPFFQKRKSSSKGNILFYKRIGRNDSVINRVLSFNNEIAPGFTVASIVNSENFDRLLQIYLLDTISRMRYAQNEYIFINSMDGMALVTNGKFNRTPINIFSSKNKAWIPIFKVEQSSSTNPSGVFYTYQWLNLASGKKSTKTSFFSYLPIWRWIIGTGFHEDDIHSIIELKRQALVNNMHKDLLHIFSYLIISSFVCYLFALFFAKRLGKNFNLFINFFKKAAEENLLIDESQVNYREFAYMAQAANQMVEQQKKTEKEILLLNDSLEQRVKQRTIELKEANKELEAFSYSVSHDLRAPLRAIQGFTTILLEDYQNLLDDEGIRLCNVIQANTLQMGRLIADLLAFSQVGKSALVYTETDMGSLVRSAIDELTASLDKTRIEVTVSTLPSISCDKALIKQVWMNLISNAIKYSSKKEHSAVEISYKSENSEILFFIKDNGIGFDMQYSDKLFLAFHRLHNIKDYEGSGIGLAIVNRIIQRHGGRVWAEAEIDKGATFYFSLPI